MRIFLGFIGVVLSLLLLIYRVRVREFIGQIAFAERIFGPGGTYTFLLLLAIFLFFFSLGVMTGTFPMIFDIAFGNFFNSVK